MTHQPEKEKPAVIRLPETTMSRKRAYMRAANGKGLVKWIWEQCDKAAGYEGTVEQRIVLLVFLLALFGVSLR